MSHPRRVRCPDYMGVLSITVGASNGSTESFHTDAWCAHDLSELWESPSLRTANEQIPKLAGVDPRSPVKAADERSIPMVFGGGYARDGTRYADPEVGLETNLDWWRTNVAGIPTSGAAGEGTRTLTLTKPSGAAVSGTVQVLRFTVGLRTRFQAVAVTRILLVDGELT